MSTRKHYHLKHNSKLWRISHILKIRFIWISFHCTNTHEKNVIFIFGKQTLRNYFSVHRHSGKNRNLYIRLADIVESNHTEILKPWGTNPLPACQLRLIYFKQLAFYCHIATKLEQRRQLWNLLSKIDLILILNLSKELRQFLCVK